MTTTIKASSTNGLEQTADGSGILGLQADNTVTFSTASTERGRFDSNGNLMVGTTTPTARFTLKGNGNTSASYCSSFYQSDGTQMFSNRNDGALFLGLLSGSPYYLTTGVAANAVVASDGFFYRSTSSIKYKTDVKDAVHGLADLLNLRPVTYKGKAEVDNGLTFGGLIAEEVDAAGLTEFVQYAEDGTPDALAYGNMVSLCIKAIQEQQAIIEQLKADVATLKGQA